MLLLLSRHSVLFISSLVLLPIISAQVTRADFPECALPCVDNAVLQATDCAIDDFACYCQPANNALIVTSATPCVVKQCDAANVPRTINVSKGLCTPGNRNPAGGVVGNGGANGGNGTGTDTTPSESSGTPAFDIPEPTVTSLEGDLIDQYGPSNTPTPTPSQSAQPVPASSTGLPAGAKAGIAIGAIAAVATIAFIAFLIYRRRRTYRSPDPLHIINDSQAKDMDMAEIAMSMQEVKYPERREPVEVDGASGGRKMSEMSVPPSFVEKAPQSLGDVATLRRDSQTLRRPTQDFPSLLSPPDDDAASAHIGPLPSPLDFFPTPPSREEMALEEGEMDFAYQRRKLEERRARIEERKRLNEEEEQVAMEEEALRRKEAARARRDG